MYHRLAPKEVGLIMWGKSTQPFVGIAWLSIEQGQRRLHHCSTTLFAFEKGDDLIDGLLIARSPPIKNDGLLCSRWQQLV